MANVGLLWFSTTSRLGVVQRHFAHVRQVAVANHSWCLWCCRWCVSLAFYNDIWFVQLSCGIHLELGYFFKPIVDRVMCCYSGHMVFICVLLWNCCNSSSTGLCGRMNDGNDLINFEQGLLCITFLLTVLRRLIVLQILLWQSLMVESQLELTFPSCSRNLFTYFSIQSGWWSGIEMGCWCCLNQLSLLGDLLCDNMVMWVWIGSGFYWIEFVLVVVNSTRD